MAVCVSLATWGPGPYNRSFRARAVNAAGDESRNIAQDPMLYYQLGSLYVLTCLVLLLVILLQQGKGGDIASAFGGSSSQTAFGARAGATLLTRVTTVCAALFMVGALALAIIGQKRTGLGRERRAGPGTGDQPASDGARGGQSPAPRRADRRRLPARRRPPAPTPKP